MMFPKPSEAFACRDVVALTALNTDVSVHCLRFPHPDHDSLVNEHGLDPAAIHTMTPGLFLLGWLRCIRHPVSTCRLLALLVKQARPVSQLVKSLALLPAAFVVADRIRKQMPDVVHLFWGHFPAMVGYLLQRDKPRLTHFVGAYDLEYGYGPTVPVLAIADFVFTHANTNVDRIASLGVPREKIIVIHRGVETVNVSPSPKKTPGLVVIAGRLERSKSVDEGLDVFERIHARVPNAQLVVAGSGSEAEALRKKAMKSPAAGSISFVGHIPQDKLARLFSDAEVCLMMSRSLSDRLPNVLKEAMVRECVPVSSQTAGISELIEDSQDGYIVEIGDIEGAAERVIALLSSPETRLKMGRAAAQTIRQRFDVRVNIQAYRDRWLSMVELS